MIYKKYRRNALCSDSCCFSNLRSDDVLFRRGLLLRKNITRNQRELRDNIIPRNTNNHEYAMRWIYTKKCYTTGLTTCLWALFPEDNDRVCFELVIDTTATIHRHTWRS